MSEPLAQKYEREKARNVQLRATLVQLEHVSRMDLPVEPPRDVLPMPKPGDRKYSQVRWLPQRSAQRLTRPHLRR